VRPALRIAIAVLAVTIAGCAASPATLVALPSPADSEPDASPGASPGTTVLLRRVVMPGYLEDYPVVIGRSGNTLLVSRDTEWAERLSDAVARVLRDALSQKLGASHVLIEGDGRIPDADLGVEVLALDPQQGGLRLDAKWSFSCTRPGQLGSADRTVLEVALEDSTATAVASATSEALDRLAAVLAARARCVNSDAN
jgi:uncharacterized lipoprotein YmbA